MPTRNAAPDINLLRRCAYSLSSSHARNNFNLIDIFSDIYHPKYYSAVSIKNAWRDYLLSFENKHTLNLYLHVPYCTRKCYYCNCATQELTEIEDLEKLKESFIRDFRFFSTAFSKVKFENVYIGGGSPSAFSIYQLEDIFSDLFSTFKIATSGERSFEMYPADCSHAKLGLLKRYNFNRISFGLQSLQPSVLRNNNRAYQTNDAIARFLRWAKNMDFEHINCDLILGLFSDTNKYFIESFRRTMDFGPTSIYVYQIVPTYDYIHRYFKSDYTQLAFFCEQMKSGILDKIIKMAHSHGYTLYTNADGIRLTDPSWVFVKDGTSAIKNGYPVSEYDINAESILGFGKSSFSCIYARLHYRNVSAIRRKPYIGIAFDARKEMLLYIISRFTFQNFISRNDFYLHFNRDILLEFSSSIKALKANNFVSVEKDKIFLKGINKIEKMLTFLFFVEKRDLRINKTIIQGMQ